MGHITTGARIIATINACMTEIAAPLYYNIATLCGIVKSSCPPRAMVITALRRLGYECSLTHCKPGLLKTTAPPEVLWDFVRTYCKANKHGSVETDQRALAILNADNTKEIALEIDENVKLEILRDKERCKYYKNPTKGFGPKAATKMKKTQ
jgi:tRNA (guanine26-N2/guanine27-N2)-dimethyltransferase